MMSTRSLVVIVLIVGIITSGLGLYRSSLLHQTQAPPESESLSESLDEVEDGTTFMRVENQVVLYEAIPSAASSIINQIYRQHYEASGKLERNARIDGEVTQTGNVYTFIVVFTESGKKQLVTVNMNNSTTNDYTISIKDQP